MNLGHILPHWLKAYRRDAFSGDLVAGLVVTVMLIPQSLAYAMLAGLPPQMGLYASILPLFAYAFFGTSMTLAVGPVAVASLMTASALTPLAEPGSDLYVMLAMQMAMLSGFMLFAAGTLKLGFLARLLSHPVISGFISGSALLIALSQLGPLLGVRLERGGLHDTLPSLWASLNQIHVSTAIMGVSALGLLYLARVGLAPLLIRLGLGPKPAGLLSKLAPMLVVLLSIAAVQLLGLEAVGVRVVGNVPEGLPHLQWIWPDLQTLSVLLVPAALLSLVGFVESVSVAQSLALKRRERIDPNRELLGLGAANLASAVSGGYAVTGGFARSVVNFAAGANTPLAGVISAGLMLLVLVGLTGLFAALPHAVLAATIIVAVLGLVDFHALRQAWRYDRADALALGLTALGVLFLGVEPGILIGVGLTILTLLWRASRPHVAVLGQLPGTEHFRNVLRFPSAIEAPSLLLIRIDENLFFGNAAALEDLVVRQLAHRPQVRHVILVMSSVNHVDTTAMEALVELQVSLAAQGMALHLAEVKGPVADRLQRSPLWAALQQEPFVSTQQAWTALREGQYISGRE